MLLRSCLVLPAIALSGCSPVPSPGPMPPFVEPGGTPGDANMALTNPDEYAWRLFLYLNRQAEVGQAGVADPEKRCVTDYESDTATESYPVVWETWALASGTDAVSNDSEVFRRPATRPVPWSQLDRRGSAKVFVKPVKLFAATDASNGFLINRDSARSCIVVTDVGGIGVDESRMNRETYEVIREAGLYSIEGLDASYVKARESGKDHLVDFPAGAKEIKARWIKIDPSEKDLYHYRIVNGIYYGLFALHIITHDLDKWFWCDFGHVQSESLPSNDPRNIPRDSTTVTTNGIRPETQGDASHQKWSNYRLRGTQIAYTDANGNPTILANPRLEADFQRSSCIGCHALASVGLHADHPEYRFSTITGKSGVASLRPDPCQVTEPTPNQFTVDGVDKPFIKVGFVWAIPFRAFSERETAPPHP